MVIQNGDAAVEAAPTQSLENHDGTGVGVLLQQFSDGGVEGLQFAGSLGPGMRWRRLDEIFGPVRRFRFKWRAICSSDHFWCQ